MDTLNSPMGFDVGLTTFPSLHFTVRNGELIPNYSHSGESRVLSFIIYCSLLINIFNLTFFLKIQLLWWFVQITIKSKVFVDILHHHLAEYKITLPPLCLSRNVTLCLCSWPRFLPHYWSLLCHLVCETWGFRACRQSWSNVNQLVWSEAKQKLIDRLKVLKVIDLCW